MKLLNYVKKINTCYPECSDQIKMIRYKSYPELKELVDRFLKKYREKMVENRCHVISMQIAKEYPDKIKYIEGYTCNRWLDTQIILPVQHAWSKWNDLYFDLSAELIIKNNFDEYVKLVEADLSNLYQQPDHPLFCDDQLFGYHILDRLKL